MANPRRPAGLPSRRPSTPASPSSPSTPAATGRPSSVRLGHVGQDEAIAGQGAGRELAAEGPRRCSASCTRPATSGSSSGVPVPRPRGFGGRGDVPAGGHQRPSSGAQSTIAVAAAERPVHRRRPDAELRGRRRGGRPRPRTPAPTRGIATFDLNQDVISGIQDGSIAFAVDQQPYEQGYLPIVMLTAVREEPEHRRRRPAGPHRPGDRRLRQRRRDRRPGPRPVRAERTRDRQSPAPGTAGTAQPTSGSPVCGPLRGLLVTPELGALVGAVVVFIVLRRAVAGLPRGEGDRQLAGPGVDARHHGGRRGAADDRRSLRPVGRRAHRDDGARRSASSPVEFRQNIWVAIGVALLIALAVGFFNGWLVTRTGLPSFIITLGTFLMLQGLNLGLTKAFTDTVTVGGIDDVPGYASRGVDLRLPAGHRGHRVPGGHPVVGCCSPRWPRGCCCAPGSATGCSPRAVTRWPRATSASPPDRTTITLFMTTAAAGWFVGTTLAVRLDVGAGQHRHRAGAHLHRGRGHRRLPAHRRLRLGDRGVARRAHLRHDPARHPVPALGR